MGKLGIRVSRTFMNVVFFVVLIAIIGIWLFAPEPSVTSKDGDDIPFVEARGVELKGAILRGGAPAALGVERASSSPAVSGNRNLRLAVVSATGASVEALVFMGSDAGAFHRMGSVSTQNPLRIPIAIGPSELTLIVRARGHVPTTLAVSVPAGVESIRRDLTLPLSARLFGTVELVIDGDARVPVVDASVYALPINEIPRSEFEYESLSRSPLSLRGKTDSDGRFSIDGAEGGVKYRIAAFESAGVGSALGIAGGEEEVAILLKRLFVLAYRVVDESGAELPRYDGLFWWPTSGVSSVPGLDHLQHATGLASEALKLWGLAQDASFASEVLSRRACIVWYGYSGAGSDRLGPLRSRITFPGYESVSADLYAYPLSGSSLNIQEIPLRQVESFAGFGTLSVGWTLAYDRVAPLEAPGAEVAIENDVLLLVQVRRVGGEAPLSFDGQAMGIAPGTVHFKNVPTGEYIVWVSAPNLRSFSKTRVGSAVVAAGETTRVKYNVPRSASLEICCPASDRGERPRAHVFKLQWQGQKGLEVRKPRVLEGKSFRQRHLEAGIYHIVDAMIPARYEAIEVNLKPGEARVVMLPEGVLR